MADANRQMLRGAAYRGDGEVIVDALQTADLELVSQLTGDAVLRAIALGVAGATEIGRRLVETLDRRDWQGDADLATELEAALGGTERPELVELAVDLAEVSELLEDARDGGGAIDLHSGEVYPTPALEYLTETNELDADLDDEDAWLVVPTLMSSMGYADMAAFIEVLPNADLADRLSNAIAGRGAFRRFRDILDVDDDQLDHWYAFSEERRLGRAREWLAGAGYRPIVDPRPRPVA